MKFANVSSHGFMDWPFPRISKAYVFFHFSGLCVCTHSQYVVTVIPFLMVLNVEGQVEEYSSLTDTCYGPSMVVVPQTSLIAVVLAAIQLKLIC